MNAKGDDRQGGALNTDLRKFLKAVGISSQRKIEEAVEAALKSGALNADTPVRARMTLELPDLGVTHVVEQDLSSGAD